MGDRSRALDNIHMQVHDQRIELPNMEDFSVVCSRKRAYFSLRSKTRSLDLPYFKTKKNNKLFVVKEMII